MAQNILKNLPQDVLYRIDVDFSITDNNLDAFIGRTAHIQFLECQNAMKMLIYRFKEFFPWASFIATHLKKMCWPNHSLR